MTIGSTAIGTGPIAGTLGVIVPDHPIATLSQSVVFSELVPDHAITTLQQSVVATVPDHAIATLQQRVIAAGTQPTDKSNRPPRAYVYIDGVDYSGRTKLDTVSISRGEGQNATASIFVFFPRGEQIFVPSFNGKPIQIFTHQNPLDASSPLDVMYTGTINRATHDHIRKGLQFECSDLRDERVGDESKDELRALTGGLYSEVTQKKDAEGREYVAELMKTVPGGLCYARDGSLRFYTWGTAGKTPVKTFTDSEVAYQNLSTDFQTRSEVRNVATIKVQYRYYRRNRFKVTLETKRPRVIEKEAADGSVTGYDVQTFTTDAMVDRANSFAPWETLSYEIIPAKAVAASGLNTGNAGMAELGHTLRGRAIGFKADLQRRIAQPVLQEYELRVICPQSIDAYGKEIEGGNYSYSLENEFDRSSWEENGHSYGADSKRDELAHALNCAYAIACKDLIRNHRKNYVSFVHNGSIDPYEIGDVIAVNNRIKTTVGQIVGLDYTIADGIRRTTYRLAVSYMDTDMPAPVEDWTAPEVNVYSGLTISTLRGNSGYENGNLFARTPVIPERYTNELTPTKFEGTYNLPLENTNIILINGR